MILDRKTLWINVAVLEGRGLPLSLLQTPIPGSGGSGGHKEKPGSVHHCSCSLSLFYQALLVGQRHRAIRPWILGASRGFFSVYVSRAPHCWVDSRRLLATPSFQRRRQAHDRECFIRPARVHHEAGSPSIVWPRSLRSRGQTIDGDPASCGIRPGSMKQSRTWAWRLRCKDGVASSRRQSTRQCGARDT